MVMIWGAVVSESDVQLTQELLLLRLVAGMDVKEVNVAFV